MIKKNEIITIYEDNGFIIKQSGPLYSIRAPDWMEKTKTDKEIHDKIMKNHHERLCSIEKMLTLLIDNSLLVIE